MAKSVAVLMGGWGEERDISLRTGEAVAAALAARGRVARRIFAGPGLDRALRAANVDQAFIALHGRMGEDGRVQGMLEVMNIPYTGSGVMASATAMHKRFAKKLFRYHNLPTPPAYGITPARISSLMDEHGDLGFPCAVKPARGGSSIGLSIVSGEQELAPAVIHACRFGGEALIERWIRGREVTVGILGDAVLGSCEIAHAGQAFNFNRKYRGGSRYFLPPRLSPTRIANLESLALGAYGALGCRGYGRVDLIASDDENDQLLEVNTLPGLTRTSLLPKIAAHAGMSFDQLVESILAFATLDECTINDVSRADGIDTSATLESLPRPA